jgi:hypothetical protein
MYTFRHKLFFSALMVVLLVSVFCQDQIQPFSAQPAQPTVSPTQMPLGLAESYRLAARVERLLPSSSHKPRTFAQVDR